MYRAPNVRDALVDAAHHDAEHNAALRCIDFVDVMRPLRSFLATNCLLFMEDFVDH